jgi:SAM-dependent methyltransferase
MRLHIEAIGAGVIGLLLLSLSLTAQIREYDWYPEFRRWMQSSIPAGQRGLDAVSQQYRNKLQGEGVDATEIERRLSLLRTKGQELENDFWNRYFTIDQPAFNTEPNSFLVSIVEGRKPGKALDVGMGEGRNALYLAKAGWTVTGIDPAEQAMALASKRASALGLTLQTVAALDTAYDFGQNQWDLILYSWVPPTSSAAKAIQGLRPGGVVVFEGRRDWFPPNGLLKMFDALRVVHYEDRIAKADFFNRTELPVVRMAAEKPLK